MDTQNKWKCKFENGLREIFGDVNKLSQEEKYKIYRKNKVKIFELYEEAFDQGLLEKSRSDD